HLAALGHAIFLGGVGVALAFAAVLAGAGVAAALARAVALAGIDAVADDLIAALGVRQRRRHRAREQAGHRGCEEGSRLGHFHSPRRGRSDRSSPLRRLPRGGYGHPSTKSSRASAAGRSSRRMTTRPMSSISNTAARRKSARSIAHPWSAARNAARTTTFLM